MGVWAERSGSQALAGASKAGCPLAPAQRIEELFRVGMEYVDGGCTAPRLQPQRGDPSNGGRQQTGGRGPGLQDDDAAHGFGLPALRGSPRGAGPDFAALTRPPARPPDVSVTAAPAFFFTGFMRCIRWRGGDIVRTTPPRHTSERLISHAHALSSAASRRSAERHHYRLQRTDFRVST